MLARGMGDDIGFEQVKKWDNSVVKIVTEAIGGKY